MVEHLAPERDAELVVQLAIVRTQPDGRAKGRARTRVITERPQRMTMGRVKIRVRGMEPERLGVGGGLVGDAPLTAIGGAEGAIRRAGAGTQAQRFSERDHGRSVVPAAIEHRAEMVMHLGVGRL